MAKTLFKKINLGYNLKPIEEVSSKKRKTMYPSMFISHKKLPLSGEDVGKSFNCQITVDLVGIREETKNEENKYNYDFEIKNIVFVKK